MIIKCPACEQKNKFSAKKLADHPTCGACKTVIDHYAYPVNLSEVEFDDLIENATGPVVVDFWSPTCGPCLMAAPELDKYASANPDVLVVKVNAQKNMGLMQRFAIRGVPTFKVFNDGKEVYDTAGYLDAEQMQTQFSIG